MTPNVVNGTGTVEGQTSCEEDKHEDHDQTLIWLKTTFRATTPRPWLLEYRTTRVTAASALEDLSTGTNHRWMA
jgi:hypothetical protein